MKGKLYNFSGLIIRLLLLTCALMPEKILAQLPQCDPTVPYYYVNLVGQPAGVWISPPHSRDGYCCSASGSDDCTSFEVVLDSTAVALSFNFVSGAVPPGALYYQINCGPPVPVGQPICISGPGPHRITFCKPGNNQNTYSITSISTPTAPPNDTIRKGCNMNISALGMVTSTVTWNSIYPGAPGQYNSYLSCTSGCDSPNFNPDDNAPEYIHYVVCGDPIADECGFNLHFCDTVVIRTLERLEGSVLPSPASICATGGSVVLTGTATGGDGNYQYFWKDNLGNIVSGSATYTAVDGGNYTLEIKDGLFGPTCPAALINVPVSEIATPSANAGPDQEVCGNSTSVTLSGSVTSAPIGTWVGGNGTFTPSRNSLNATYAPTAAEIASGSVSLVLSTSGTSGCPNAKDTVVIRFTPPISLDLPNDTVPCYGQTMSYSPVVSGGVPPYTYSWNNGATTTSVNVPAGSYCVTVSDAKGCALSDCGQLINPTLLQVSITKTDVTVVAGSDGTATANITGGTAPYNVLWSDGQTTVTAENLTKGTYNVTVTDANGCTVSGTISIGEPLCLGFSVDINASNPLCAGSSDGKATATVTGGVIPLIYNWSTGDIGPTIANLSPGVYTVVVTDINLCQASASVNIVDPAVLTSLATGTDVTIVGGSDGSASVAVSGGTAPYTYSWSNGATTASVNNLSQGTYTYTVTDDHGCQTTGTIVINDPDCTTRTISLTHNDVKCNNGADGTATGSMNFGTAPFTYLWSDGQTSNEATGLSAGTYSVTITDSLNCTVSGSVTVSEPALLEYTLTSENVSCNGGFDGSINLTVTGGTFPYFYSWSNGITAEDPINLFAGNYSFNVTDNNGCTVSGAVTITQPQKLAYTYTKTDVSCNGGTNGTIDVTVTGGTLPYSFLWNNGQASEDLTGLTEGSYFLTVTDANGCQIVSAPSILVDEPEVMVTKNVTIDCPVPGSAVTNVTVAIDGGTSPYSVSFDNGVTYGSAGVYSSTLAIGSSYNVLIKDSNGCYSPAAFTFTIPGAVVLQTATFNPCVTPGSSTSLVNVSPAGGTGPYQISWDNGSTFGNTGNYSSQLGISNSFLVIASDANGCKSLPLQVNIPDSLYVSATAGTYPGGFNVSCKGASDGSITLAVAGGSPAYNYQWTGPNSFSSSSMNISSLSEGLYTVIVTDSNSCSKTVLVNIFAPDNLQLEATSTQYNGGYNISCNGLSDGSISSAVSGGSAPYEYQWSGPDSFTSTNQNISGLVAGVYTITVKDQNGCSTSGSITLQQPDGVKASAIASSYNGFGVSCYNSDDGSISVETLGGTQPYTYAWTGPNGYTSNGQNLGSVKAGTYTAVITDNNNCQITLIKTLTEPEPIVLKGSSTPAACGNAVGTIDLVPGGGVTPYQFSWSHGITTEDPGSLAAGIYGVTLTDDNGCTATLSIEVERTDVLTASSSVRNATCNGDADGHIELTMLSGREPFEYYWSNGNNSEDIGSLQAGTYSVEVIDYYGCKLNETFTVGQPDKLVVTATTSVYNGGYNVSTHNGSDGSIDVTVTGGNQPYQIMWSNGSAEMDLSNLSPGKYTVTCNAGGCIESATVELKDPSGLEMPSAFSPNGDGANETFFVKGLDAYPDNQIVIVNRWGNEVFSTTNYKNDWTGINGEGKELPDGTYFVILEIKGENLVLKGYVDLRR